MRCDDVMVNLPDYLLGKIEPNLAKCIAVHLEACERCAAELDELREPLKVLGAVGREEYPDAFWQHLHASIMEKAGRPSPARWRMPAYAGAIAVLLVVAGVGIFQLFRQPATERAQSVAALATSLSPDQAVTLPSMNVNYVDAVSSQANELDEIDVVDDSLQQAVVSALWNAIGDSTSSADAINYIGNTFSN